MFDFEKNKKLLIDNLDYLKNMSVEEQTLYKKWQELNEANDFTSRKGHIRDLEENLWTPADIADVEETIHQINGMEIYVQQVEDVKYDITENNETVDRLKDATVVITNKVIFDKEIFNKCEKLKLIAVAATGYNIIDVETAVENGIAVTNVPGYSTYSVAQLTMTFVLALATNLIKNNSASHDGTWSNSKIFTLGNCTHMTMV